MPSNLSFIKQLGHFWYLYLLGGLLSVLLLSLSITIKTRPQDVDKFSVFAALSEDKVDSAVLESQIKEAAPSLKKVTITACSPEGSLYSSYLSTYAAGADLLVFPATSLTPKGANGYFLLPESYRNSLNYLDEANQAKGFLLNQSDHLYLSESLKYGEGDYYLFISSSSVHLLPYLSSAKTAYVQTILGALLA